MTKTRSILSEFLRLDPLKGGFANQVYIHPDGKKVLKKYNDNQHYLAELFVHTVNFDRKPQLLESGQSTDGKPYVILSFEGKPVVDFNPNDIDDLAETIALLHKSKHEINSGDVIANKFGWLKEYHSIISEDFDIDIIKLLVRNTDNRSTQLGSLVHGDITQSNLRMVDGKFFLIDFDEAAYADPRLEISKLYWSHIPIFKEWRYISSFLKAYNKDAAVDIEVDQYLKDLILMAGLDYWGWRYLHLSDIKLVQRAADDVREYIKYARYH